MNQILPAGLHYTDSGLTMLSVYTVSVVKRIHYIENLNKNVRDLRKKCKRQTRSTVKYKALSLKADST